MKPSTLTPSGRPHDRGFLVRMQDGRTGRTYHRETYIKDKVAVYPEITPGTYDERGVLCARDHLTIIGYLD